MCVCVCVCYSVFLCVFGAPVPRGRGQHHSVVSGPWRLLLAAPGGAEEVQDVYGGEGISPVFLLTQEGEESLPCCC